MTEEQENDQGNASGTRSEFPEIDAMRTVATALADLDPAARQRVLVWAVGAFELEARTEMESRLGTGPPESPSHHARHKTGSPGMPIDFNSPANLYDAANPQTYGERALVMGYWFQKCQGNTDFTAKEVNDELKHLGYPVSNITGRMSELQNTKPALARQTSKSGKSRQARKRYVITEQGARKVAQMITGESDDHKGE